MRRRLVMAGGGSGSFPGPISEQGRWSARSVILEPTETWEGLGILEPSVVHEGSEVRLYYRGGGLHGPNTAAGVAIADDGDDLSDPASWTKYSGNPIYGNGVGGESADIICPFVYFEVSSGTSILYYSTGSALKAATATDGLTFGVWDTLMSLPSGCSLWGNSCVWKEGANWYGYFEAYVTAGGYWATFYATSANGANWTLGNGGAELTSLQVASGGTYSVPDIQPEDPKLGGSLYQGWYHASAITGNTESDIFRATSPDRITWTQVTPAPILTHSGTGFEVDQIADPALVEVSGTSYMFMDADDGGTDIAAIEVASFAGTLAQIVAGS